YQVHELVVMLILMEFALKKQEFFGRKLNQPVGQQTVFLKCLGPILPWISAAVGNQAKRGVGIVIVKQPLIKSQSQFLSVNFNRHADRPVNSVEHDCKTTVAVLPLPARRVD